MSKKIQLQQQGSVPWHGAGAVSLFFFAPFFPSAQCASLCKGSLTSPCDPLAVSALHCLLKTTCHSVTSTAVCTRTHPLSSLILSAPFSDLCSYRLLDSYWASKPLQQVLIPKEKLLRLFLRAELMLCIVSLFLSAKLGDFPQQAEMFKKKTVSFPECFHSLFSLHFIRSDLKLLLFIRHPGGKPCYGNIPSSLMQNTLKDKVFPVGFF